MILVPGKGKDVLVDLLNQSNVLPYPLLPDEVLFSALKIINGPLPTAVGASVIAIPGSKYDGLVSVEWNRMDLTSAFGGMIPKIKGLSNGNLHSMLPWIGQELGIELFAEDFLQVDYSNLQPNEQVNIQLTATATSMSYVGNFIIQFTRLRPDLVTEFKVTGLDVYNWPGWVKPVADKDGNFPAAKRQINMDVYSRDFTEFYSLVMKHPNANIFYDGSGIRQVMSNIGYSNWPVGWSNPIYDYSTADVPESNRDYDRVIVQAVRDIKNIQTMPYEGTAYFHYNVT